MTLLEQQLSTVLARAVAHETERGVFWRKQGVDHEFPAWIDEAVEVLAEYKDERDRELNPPVRY